MTSKTSTGMIQTFDDAGLQRFNLFSLTKKSWSNDLITFFKYPEREDWQYNIFSVYQQRYGNIQWLEVEARTDGTNVNNESAYQLVKLFFFFFWYLIVSI